MQGAGSEVSWRTCHTVNERLIQKVLGKHKLNSSGELCGGGIRGQKEGKINSGKKQKNIYFTSGFVS